MTLTNEDEAGILNSGEWTFWDPAQTADEEDKMMEQLAFEGWFILEAPYGNHLEFLMERTGLSAKQVVAMFETLTAQGTKRAAFDPKLLHKHHYAISRVLEYVIEFKCSLCGESTIVDKFKFRKKVTGSRVFRR